MKDHRSNVDVLGPDDTSQNNLIGLRGVLFTELRALPAKATKEQLEVAKMKVELANTIIYSAKIETLYLQARKGGMPKTASRFFIEEKEVEPGKE